VIVYYDFEVESVDTEEAASVRGVTVIEPRQGAAVVELLGDHDLSTQPELNELLAGLIAGHELVVVDISEATFIDSTFIHGLWLANQAAASRAATFRVQLGTARIVDRVVEISHIGDLIEIVSTREAALAAPPLR
jgi:anti-anti-sigma factor